MCVATKEIKVYPNNKPWVTKRLKTLIHEKNLVYKSGDKCKLREIEKQIKRVIKEEKEKYKEKMETNLKECNSLQAWKMIKDMGGIDNKSSEAKTTIKVNEDLLNDFYCRFDIASTDESDDNDYSINDIPTIEEQEVRTIFKKLNTRKAPGPDGLNACFLRSCCDQLSAVFTTIFQRSLKEGKVPTTWKSSTIVPVPKIKSPSQLNDYRPVALTSIPMKCLEKIMKKFLLQEVDPLLDPLQFAYQTSKGVEDALLTVIDSITKHYDQSPSNYSRLLFVDFSSAFNAMNTNTLIQKLKDLNISSYITTWFKDFLYKRPQRVKVGNKYSKERTLSNGCPQGCVSSPILYIIYTNDCLGLYENCKIIKYADDTAILGMVDSSSESLENYFHQVSMFVDWCNSNSLDLNVKKTKEQIFDFRRKALPHEEIKINNQKVEQVNTFKYLGLTIDNCLSFKSHVEKTKNKAAQRMHILRKLRTFNISKKTMLQIYHSLILSIITFSFTVWYGSCGVKEKSQIQSLINKSSKIINSEVETATSLYQSAVKRKAKQVIKQPSHPLKSQFKLLPSGKRYVEIKARTNKYKFTFLPSAIKSLN